MTHSTMNSVEGSNFILEDLISREHLILRNKVTDVAAAFELVLPTDGVGKIRRPLIIGIDGSVTAGKSFLATALHKYLTGKSVNCVIVHGDWFMVSRAQRKKEIEKAAKGGYRISSYDAIACDFAALARTQARIRDFLNSGRDHDTIIIPNAYNRETGELDRTIRLELSETSVVVIEGTGVLGAEAEQIFDLSIRVDVGTYEETIRRLVARETEKALPQRLEEKFIKERYDLIDCPYDQYLRSRDSRYFEFLLDTSEPTAMRLYGRS